MLKVLLHSNIQELDRSLEPVKYENLCQRHSQSGGNPGNKLFLNAIQNYLNNAEGVYVEHLTSQMDYNYINNTFDLIIWPLANCFNASQDIIGYIKSYTERINNYKIPVLALGAGAQASSYDDINKLAEAIREPAIDFINAVHNTGGIFGLRGYFTLELFKKLVGNTEDVVIGCPSMYQMGRNLQINKLNLAQNELTPAINGNFNTLNILGQNRIFDIYSSAIFFDQGQFISLLYGDEIKNQKISYMQLRKLINHYTFTGMKLLCEDRIACIYDIPMWGKFILDHQINFSFGQRIHGSFICALLGIPSVVAYCDSRTRELAEYFELPTYKLNKKDSVDLYKVYCDSKFDRFNKNFPSKFDKFEKMLSLYGVPKISEKDNSPFKNFEIYQYPHALNQNSYIKYMMNKKWIRTIWDR